MRLRLLLSFLCGRKKGSAAPVGPSNTAAPAISGTARIGQTLTSSSGTWSGTGTISYAYQWRRNGANIGGATANTYTLVAGDDQSVITCRVTATDDNGSVSVSTAGVTALYAAPAASGGLSDQTYDQNTGDQTVNAATDFSGASGGSWSVTGAGASIDGSGVVTIPTSAVLSGAVVTVTYTNSGGFAQSAFQVTVSAPAVSGAFSSAFSSAFDVAA